MLSLIENHIMQLEFHSLYRTFFTHPPTSSSYSSLSVSSVCRQKIGDYDWILVVETMTCTTAAAWGGDTAWHFESVAPDKSEINQYVSQPNFWCVTYLYFCAVEGIFCPLWSHKLASQYIGGNLYQYFFGILMRWYHGSFDKCDQFWWWLFRFFLNLEM